MSIGDQTPHIGSYVIIEERVYRNEAVCRFIKRIRGRRLQRIAVRAIDALKGVPVVGKWLRGNLIHYDKQVIKGE